MIAATFWGLVGASALVVGAEIAFKFQLSKLVIGLIMAFGVGALISSIAFELVQPSLENASTLHVSLALLVGSLTFFIGDMYLLNIPGKSSGRVRL